MRGHPGWRARAAFGLAVASIAALGGAAAMSVASGAATVRARPLWAVGYTSNFQRLYTEGPIVERFDGSSWRPVPSPQPFGGQLDAVATVGLANAWAVGNLARFHSHALIEHWTGAAWKLVPSPRGPVYELSAVAGDSPHDVWAVGQSGGALSATLVEHWTGSAWQQVPSPSPSSKAASLSAVAALSRNDAWAVGTTDKPLIEHWNGAAWKVIAGPNVRPGGLVGLSAVSAKDIWAVGSSGRQKPGTLIEHWNGTVWRRSPSPSPGNQTGLEAVTALSPRNAWAVGSIFNDSGTHYTLIEHWNGSVWRQVASPTPALSVRWDVSLHQVAAVSPSSVWAAGDYDTGHAWMTLAEHWNGTTWQQVATANPRQGSHLVGVG